MQRTRTPLGSPRRTASTASGVVLPPDRAFVLHLDGGTRPPRPMAGRVEHITSGRVGHFGSLGELVAFLADVLATDPGRG